MQYKVCNVNMYAGFYPKDGEMQMNRLAVELSVKASRRAGTATDFFHCLCAIDNRILTKDLNSSSLNPSGLKCCR